VLTRLTDTPDAQRMVNASVSVSKRNDCAAGVTISVKVDDLQEMYNDFQRQLQNGMAELAKTTGTTVVSVRPPAPDSISKAKELYASKDFAAALPLFKKASEAGNAEATAYLGDYYYKDLFEITGVPKDDSEAVRLYRKAAEAGNGRGMSKLGLAYIAGEGVSKDNDAGVRWFRKAIDAGNAEGMMRLGIAYEQGTGVPKDYAESVKWLRQAADAGNDEAMLEVGFDFEHGQGVVADWSEAERWYSKAAELGNDSAVTLLKSLRQRRNRN
jgi:TPR repeat protein